MKAWKGNLIINQLRIPGPKKNLSSGSKTSKDPKEQDGE